MCRNYMYQQTALAQAKIGADEVYAVYERGPVNDLVGIAKVIGDVAHLFDVHRYGDIEPLRVVRNWNKPSRREIARMFDLDHLWNVQLA